MDRNSVNAEIVRFYPKRYLKMHFENFHAFQDARAYLDKFLLALTSHAVRFYYLRNEGKVEQIVIAKFKK